MRCSRKSGGWIGGMQFKVAAVRGKKQLTVFLGSRRGAEFQERMWRAERGPVQVNEEPNSPLFGFGDRGAAKKQIHPQVSVRVGGDRSHEQLTCEVSHADIAQR